MHLAALLAPLAAAAAADGAAAVDGGGRAAGAPPIPDNFWPSVESWYWGGTCYVCRLAVELARLRLERHRVHLSLAENLSAASALPLPLGTWQEAVCADVVTLLVDTSTELDGFFLSYLASVLMGKNARWHGIGRVRDFIVDWIAQFVRSPEDQFRKEDGVGPDARWIWNFRGALRASAQSLCSLAWDRQVVPWLGSSMQALREMSLHDDCPCSESAPVVFKEIVQNRIWLVSNIYPSLQSLGLCERLASILEGWRLLRPLLSPSLVNDEQVHRATCVMAQNAPRPVAVWQGLDLDSAAPEDDRWFESADTNIESQLSGPSKDCLTLAAALSTEMLAVVQDMQGIFKENQGPLEGRSVCKLLVGASSQQSALEDVMRYRSLSAWYFANEGLIQSSEESLGQHRTVVPIMDFTAHPIGSEVGENPLSTYFGPWRSNYAAAVRDRKALYSVFLVVGTRIPMLHNLLRIIEDSLIFYRKMGVSEQGRDSNRVVGEQLTSNDPKLVLEREEAKWESDLFESLRYRAIAHILSEIEELNLPFAKLCTQLRKPSFKLQWIGRSLFEGWCRSEGIAERTPEANLVDGRPTCKPCSGEECRIRPRRSPAVSAPLGRRHGRRVPQLQEPFHSGETQCNSKCPAPVVAETKAARVSERTQPAVVLAVLCWTCAVIAFWEYFVRRCRFRNVPAAAVQAAPPPPSVPPQRQVQILPPAIPLQPLAGGEGLDAAPLVNLDLSAILTASLRERIIATHALPTVGPAPAA